MTLNQYYDNYTRKTFKLSWNLYCTSASIKERDWLKKKLKKQYKLEFKKGDI